MAKGLISDVLDKQSDLLLSLENYIFGLAKRRKPDELEFLFREMPFLMEHATRRPSLKQAGDWQWLSLPWAIFDDITEYEDSAKACMRVLARAGFQPNGHFLERMLWARLPSMVCDFCEVFEVDPTYSEGDNLSLLALAADDVSSPDGLKIFLDLLGRSGDVNAESGKIPKPVLMALFNSCLPHYSDETPDALENTLKAIESMLSAGANPNASGVMNGWAHDRGRGERLPILHAVYWAKYTGRICPELVEAAERVCDPLVTDDAGRTAEEYMRFLVESKAPL